MNELAISIDHISKEYRLGAIGGGTLRGDLQSWWARIRKKEDPNVLIDHIQYNGNTRFLALDDVSFDVKKGEALGIIGHNGAGKSTLLKLLSRVTAPTKGSISYNGRIASMLEVGTGFHPELTGRENVYMNGAILGMTKEEITKKFDEIVAFAEMEKFIDTPVKRYSSGMYVKLAFAVAAHLDNEIMVMDEVLAVGDMKFQEKSLNKMSNVANNDGRTVLYVSHNMNTIKKLCDRCIVLEKGKVIFNGNTEKAIEHYLSNTKMPALINDCSSFDRKGFNVDGKIVIRQVDILEKEKPVFQNNETIRIRITYDSLEENRNICLRMPIFYNDGTIIGMTSTLPQICCHKGRNEIIVSFRPENLAPGRYKVRLVFYTVNSFGTTRTKDVVDDAFAFEVDTLAETINSITWEHKYWGAIQFPQIIIEDEK